VLIAAHREALAALRAKARGPLFLVGKSMGGRVGCHLALELEAPVAGLICLGYPLRSGATGALRDEVLVGLRTPVLFVQGTRDPLCPLETLAEVRAPHDRPEYAGRWSRAGDHSLVVSAAVRKATATTQTTPTCACSPRSAGSVGG
jgi:predicted alpha/beta-hydrolase family hydrolase